jgi:hypothetical protein
LSNVVSGHKPVVFWPGYSEAPLGSRLTSITEREIEVRTVVAPSAVAAKSYKWCTHQSVSRCASHGEA